MAMPREARDLVVHSRNPFNAEPPAQRLRAHIITDAADFYVRSHGDIPEVDPGAFRLKVGGQVDNELSLSLAELKQRFQEHVVEAVLQCAGNRRSDLGAVKPVAGDPWEGGAIGNASWTGVRLADVLRAAGVHGDENLHVAFSSLDTCTVDGKAFKFGASIPMAKAMSPEVLLAYAMNDAPLTPKHGFPLRVITPGYAGVRSPKWLAAVQVSVRPSDNPIQAEDYKMLPPDIERPEDIDWNRGVTINEMPINSAICEPADGARVAAGRLTVRGYAMATDGDVTRVEISSDNGETWTQGELEGKATPWSWTFWTVFLDLPAGTHELVVRAWDDAGQTQPSDPDCVWNVKGYLSAAWHRIVVHAR